MRGNINLTAAERTIQENPGAARLAKELSKPAVSREVRRQMERAAAKRPAVLTLVQRDKWPDAQYDPKRIEVWLSRDYLVQVFQEAGGVLRLSCGRTTMRPDGRWNDGITWDELQEVKRQVGHGDDYAIEVYPRDCDVVNVANMRHLWVMPLPLHFGWFNR